MTNTISKFSTCDDSRFPRSQNFRNNRVISDNQISELDSKDNEGYRYFIFWRLNPKVIISVWYKNINWIEFTGNLNWKLVNDRKIRILGYRNTLCFFSTLWLFHILLSSFTQVSYSLWIVIIILTHNSHSHVTCAKLVLLLKLCGPTEPNQFLGQKRA